MLNPLKYDLMTYFNRKFPQGFFGKYALINKDIFPAVLSRTGELYQIHPDLITYVQSREQYNLDDLRTNDTVIDLGANIGAFSVMCAKRGIQKVYAYEPFTYFTLCKNIQLNKLENVIEASWYALGDGNVTRISWMDKNALVETKGMTHILDECGGCDFLKCDVEGAEWLIHPYELRNVRHIEMEFHMFDPRASQERIDSYNKHFDMTLRDRKGETLWYSGTNKYV